MMPESEYETGRRRRPQRVPSARGKPKKKFSLQEQEVRAFSRWLVRQEKAEATVKKYTRTVDCFLTWKGERPLSPKSVLAYKQVLAAKGAGSANPQLAALNQYVMYCRRPDCRVGAMRRQKNAFVPQSRELERAEYERLLVATAQLPGGVRLRLVLETLCATGIRVSELRFITVEAVENGVAEVNCKGKTRTILLPFTLRQRLKEWCAESKRSSGPVFVTRGGLPLDRSNIWKDMKRLCRVAQVPESKVFPHNLRHLFARIYYEMNRDLAHLADLLGHSSVETTRIYLLTTCDEHAKELENMGLVI